jgi:SAM-dependent methyltransferase
VSPIEERAHEQRNRAESFGAVAADYDRYRPGYPVELIDDLVALTPGGPAPGSVLDIGCGTGKAAGLLAGAGLHVVGVEVDEQMAAVARARGLRVEVGSFEAWDDRGRTFDLISCAQAWHWVDPAQGIPKVARLLNPGATLALFWNYNEVDAATRTVLEGVYERFAPQLRSSVATGTQRRDQRPYVADLRASNAFRDVLTRTYDWQRTDTIDEYVGRIGTHSDHLALGARRLKLLQDELYGALSRQVRTVTLTGGTYVILASVDRQIRCMAR